MRIVVTGSLAYDYLMTFPGSFTEHLLHDKAHTLSVSFLVTSMTKLRGGVAGNVAYNLALLGASPLLFGTVGQDFTEYRAWLDDHAIDTSGLITIPDDFTSSCFIATDSHNNQIVTFYPGAMSHTPTLSLASLALTADDLVLISASDPATMERFARECQEYGIPYVFDPGKQTPRLDAEVLRAGLRGASVLISNDYEYGMMAKKLGITEQELRESAPITVTTHGDKGSSISTSDGTTIAIPAVPITQFADPTGAGDAYLAGFVIGLVHHLPNEVTGRIAALAGAYAVEQLGTHEHHYHLDQFITRYEQVFGESSALAPLRHQS